jgi:RIO kinase 1
LFTGDGNPSLDRYEEYEAVYDPSWADPQRVRQRPRPRHRPHKAPAEILAGLTDDLSDVEMAFETTYRPSRYEEGWLLSSLQPFYDEGLLADVLALVKGGKEANVYCCRAHPATGLGLVAAKVYRPRMFRNLRNDQMYRQGREILVGSGRPAGRDAGYLERAIRNKTAFGEQAAHTSWLLYEFTALERLYAAGGAAPRAIASGDNALLMSYHGEEGRAAPTLNTVDLEAGEAQRLFAEVIRNVELMLGLGLVHGDLSAYNILYWAGTITLIDFPQVVDVHNNPQARFILERDMQRTCDYFALQGVACEPASLARALWRRYVGELSPQDRAADLSRLEAAVEETLRILPREPLGPGRRIPC